MLGLRHDSRNLAGAEGTGQNGLTDSSTGYGMSTRETRKGPSDRKRVLVDTA